MSIRLKILLIDSSSIEIINLRKFLENNNHFVISLDSTETALKFIKKDPPDIIISETTTEKIDGLELCSKMKSDKTLKKIPFIFLTIHNHNDIIIQSLESGADKFIEKPYNRYMVLNNIKQLTMKNLPLFDTFDDSRIATPFMSNYIAAIEENRDLLNKNDSLKRAIYSDLAIDKLLSVFSENVNSSKNRRSKLIDPLFSPITVDS